MFRHLHPTARSVHAFLAAGKIREEITSYQGFRNILVTVVDNGEETCGTQDAIFIFFAMTAWEPDGSAKSFLRNDAEETHEHYAVRCDGWCDEFATVNNNDGSNSILYRIVRAGDICNGFRIKREEDKQDDYVIRLEVLRGNQVFASCELNSGSSVLEFQLQMPIPLITDSGSEYQLRITTPEGGMEGWQSLKIITTYTHFSTKLRCALFDP